MALYKDGNPVSGLNSIPRLTLAQYNALNVKPEFWVRTDAPESYKKLSADQVSYDSNNTVKDKIDDVQDKIDNDFFGGQGIHAETRKSTISEAIEEVCAGNADHFFSLENFGTITDLTGMGNRQFAFGWLNNTKTYGWAIVCSFGGARYGKRNGSTTFSWSSFSG